MVGEEITTQSVAYSATGIYGGSVEDGRISGRISVESSPEQGTIVTFALPQTSSVASEEGL